MFVKRYAAIIHNNDSNLVKYRQWTRKSNDKGC